MTAIWTMQGTTRAARTERPRVLFLGSGYAGHATRFANLRAALAEDERVRPHFRYVSGWRPNGLIERIDVLPPGIRGRLRATWEARAFATLPRPDVIWTAMADVLLPHMWAQVGPLKRPLIVDTDWSLAQQEAWSWEYYGRAPKTGLRLALARFQERLLASTTTVFTPWSSWAADGLRTAGVPNERIIELPPGVDLATWQFVRRKAPTRRPLRLLFVGGDFERKGGPELVSVVREFEGRVTLDVVTRAAVPQTPGVAVHRADANSEALRALYAAADLFILPSRAECFGIATIEAMATGLPVIVADVGGARSIVTEGQEGWLIEPGVEGIRGALDRALKKRGQLPAMGEAARATAETRFDVAANTRRLVDLIMSLATGRR